MMHVVAGSKLHNTLQEKESINNSLLTISNNLTISHITFKLVSHFKIKKVKKQLRQVK